MFECETRTLMDDHIKKHHHVNGYCYECGNELAELRYRDTHVRTVHLGIRFHCTYCKKIYASNGHAQEHVKRSAWAKKGATIVEGPRDLYTHASGKRDRSGSDSDEPLKKVAHKVSHNKSKKEIKTTKPHKSYSDDFLAPAPYYLKTPAMKKAGFNPVTSTITSGSVRDTNVRSDPILASGLDFIGGVLRRANVDIASAPSLHGFFSQIEPSHLSVGPTQSTLISPSIPQSRTSISVYTIFSIEMSIFFLLKFLPFFVDI